MRAVVLAAFLAAVPCRSVAAQERAFSVRDFGAAGDGGRLDTSAIQKAVDAAAAAGGGVVRFPPGAYLSGTIVLKSGVTLRVEKDATILGSKNLDDYPPLVPACRSYTDNYTERSLIYAEGRENLCIEGPGAIDGQGAAFKGPYKRRPYLMRLVECRKIIVRDVLLKDAAMWVQHYLACDDVRIGNVRVRSRVNHNNDGIDIDGCRRVEISGCDIVSGDDAICLKSTLDRRCEDVFVRRCDVSSLCNGLKLGTETNGGFRNVRFRECRVYDTKLAGLALLIVDGGTLEDVEAEDIRMEGVGAAVFVRLGDRGRPFKEGMDRPGVGKLRNVAIRRVRAEGAGRIGSSVVGLPGHPVEAVRLEDVSIVSAGGGRPDDARRVPPERPEAYPEFNMFGVLPASGLYLRHVKGVSLERVVLRTASEDARPAVVLSDVQDHVLKEVDSGDAAVRTDR